MKYLGVKHFSKWHTESVTSVKSYCALLRRVQKMVITCRMHVWEKVEAIHMSSVSCLFLL